MLPNSPAQARRVAKGSLALAPRAPPPLSRELELAQAAPAGALPPPLELPPAASTAASTAASGTCALGPDGRELVNAVLEVPDPHP